MFKSFQFTLHIIKRIKRIEKDILSERREIEIKNKKITQSLFFVHFFDCVEQRTITVICVLSES